MAGNGRLQPFASAPDPDGYPGRASDGRNTFAYPDPAAARPAPDAYAVTHSYPITHTDRYPYECAFPHRHRHARTDSFCRYR